MESAEARALLESGRASGSLDAHDLALALDAAVLGLPMADSLTYATARRHGAVLWTQDAHYDGLPGVRYFAKPRA